MPNLTNLFYDLTSLQKTKCYIETGAYRGDGIKAVMNFYDQVHSIELSPQWVDFNQNQFRDFQNIFIHSGDSKKVLPQILEGIEEPVTIHLDAHYSGGPTAFGEEETPLIQELEFLKTRSYDDIIIIDDCRMVGKKGISGLGPDHPIYPNMNFDWTHITNKKIKSLMKEDYFLISNQVHQFTDGARDRYIMCKKPLWLV
ncbi:hypothetical protein [Polynucleobacter sphagniphilus]|jgi:hypothetical protein|uniref:Uncharacterized protein n=1 Tax=Polynucleobacter sphagniphilus TaxID=1743169 RepID=A0AA43MBH1_9BURK|nr:hypothetical protein [Polynucleobacter sphagniphilus]MDH6504707.1 hypothetical protein [Polynucleobacter sphagniphilus]MDH6513342.1 hypothetical protein [Polynucleobacter sphagniphilus]